MILKEITNMMAIQGRREGREIGGDGWNGVPIYNRKNNLLQEAGLHHKNMVKEGLP